MVHIGDDLNLTSVHYSHFARMFRHGVDHSYSSIARDTERVPAIGQMIGELFELSSRRIETKFGISLIVEGEINAAAVGSPAQIARIAVQFCRDFMGAAAVAAHHIETCDLISLKLVVIADV